MRGLTKRSIIPTIHIVHVEHWAVSFALGVVGRRACFDVEYPQKDQGTSVSRLRASQKADAADTLSVGSQKCQGYIP